MFRRKVGRLEKKGFSAKIIEKGGGAFLVNRINSLVDDFSRSFIDYLRRVSTEKRKHMTGSFISYFLTDPQYLLSFEDAVFFLFLYGVFKRLKSVADRDPAVRDFVRMVEEWVLKHKRLPLDEKEYFVFLDKFYNVLYDGFQDIKELVVFRETENKVFLVLPKEVAVSISSVCREFSLDCTNIVDFYDLDLNDGLFTLPLDKIGLIRIINSGIDFVLNNVFDEYKPYGEALWSGSYFFVGGLEPVESGVNLEAHPELLRDFLYRIKMKGYDFSIKDGYVSVWIANNLPDSFIDKLYKICVLLEYMDPLSDKVGTTLNVKLKTLYNKVYDAVAPKIESFVKKLAKNVGYHGKLKFREEPWTIVVEGTSADMKLNVEYAFVVSLLDLIVGDSEQEIREWFLKNNLDKNDQFINILSEKVFELLREFAEQYIYDL